FNDLLDETSLVPKDKPPGNPFRTYRQVIFEPIMVGPGQGLTTHWHFRPACLQGMEQLWRNLKIELTGEALTVSWDGTQVQRVTQDSIQQCTLPADACYDTSQLHFEPRGGVGVYVHNAAASLRNVRLTPILDR